MAFKKLSELELGWVAGIIEGEGCIRPNGNTPSIALYMTDKDVVEKFAKLFNKKLFKEDNRRRGFETIKIGYRTGVYGKDAVYLLELLLPYLGKRRKAKALEVLDIWYSRKKYIDKKRHRNIQIRNLYKTGKYNMAELANKFDITSGLIHYIIKESKDKW